MRVKMLGIVNFCYSCGSTDSLHLFVHSIVSNHKCMKSEHYDRVDNNVTLTFYKYWYNAACGFYYLHAKDYPISRYASYVTTFKV